MKRSLAILALSATALLYVSCSPTIQQFEFKYAEKRATLPNGLKLVVIPDTNTPMAQVNVRYEVGALEDPKGKRGLAHLVEHMMFQHRFGGVKNRPTFEILPMITAGSPPFNAYTTWEKTHYYTNARAEDIEPLVALEAARMQWGCKDIPMEQFEREREVVRNEKRQSGGPEGEIFTLILDAAYPKDHPYHEAVIGDDVQLSSITFEDVCTFMKKYYTPDRATVVIIGNVDVDRMGKMVTHYFGPITQSEPAPRQEVKELPPFEKYEVIEHPIDIERTLVSVIWRMPSLHGKDRAKVRVMEASMNARLNRFREDWNFAASVGAFMFTGGAQEGPTIAPIFMVQMELHKDSDQSKALSYVWKAADGAHRGVSDEGFDDRSKNLAKANLVLGLEAIADRAGHVADLIQFGKSVKFDSEKEYLFDDLRQIDEIDASGFKSFVRGRLKKSQARVVVLKASKDGLKGDKRSGKRFNATDAHARQTEPLLNPAEALKALPAPKTNSILSKAIRYELGNGMKVALLPIPDGMPVVTARLRFRVGASHEPADVAGLADVAAQFRGPPRDATFWQVGVRFGGSAGQDSTTFSSRGINIYSSIMLKGLERIVTAGYVSQQGIESWQKRTRVSLDSDQLRQNRAFAREFDSALYGNDHPYTTNGDVTEASVGKMGSDRLQDFARKHYSAGNAILVVAGNFDIEKIKGQIKDAFGGWGKGRVDKPVGPATTADRSEPVHIGVIGKKYPQVQVRIGYPGPVGIDSNYAARLVLSDMIRKRMAKVRSQLGSTYGIGAGWGPRIGPTIYFAGGRIDAPAAGRSLKFRRDQLDELRSGVGFDLAFAESRRAVLNQQLAEAATSAEFSSSLAAAVQFDLPSDFDAKLIEQVAKTTMDEVKQLIATELAPSKEVLVTLGSREDLEAMFAGAGLNNVRFIEPE